MAASNFTDLYNYGSYGYMGIGPMPGFSFTLTLSANGNSFWLGSCTSTHIVAYNPTNTAQYAVYSGESFRVYSPSSGSYMLVTNNPLSYTGVPTSQSIDISNKASDWDFHGLASLEGAALCIATSASGNSPDGHDYGAISSNQKTWFSYEKIVVLMADKINGCDIYAKRAEQDKDGNDLVAIPSITGNGGKILAVNDGATATEWVTKPTVDQTYNSASTNAQSGVAVAGALATVNQLPSSTSADEDKVLTVNSSGNPVWATAQGGGSSYTAGAGIDITSDVISAKIDNSTLTTDAITTGTARFSVSHTSGYDADVGQTRIMDSMYNLDTKVYTFRIPSGGIQLGQAVYADTVYPVFIKNYASNGEYLVNSKLKATLDTSIDRYVITGGQTFKVCFNPGSPYFPREMGNPQYNLTDYRYLTFAYFTDSQIEDHTASSSTSGSLSNSLDITFDYKVSGTTLSVDTDVVQPKLTAGDGIAISDSNVISVSEGEEVPITGSTSYSYQLGTKLNYNHLRIYFHKYNGSSSSGHLVKDVYSDVSFSGYGFELSDFYYGTLGTTTFTVSGGSTTDVLNVGSSYFSTVSGNSITADSNSSWVIDRIFGFNDSPFASQS